MKKDDEKALDIFLEEDDETSTKEKAKKAKNVILDEREGLIERVNTDRILVTKDGKQLLREIY